MFETLEQQIESTEGTHLTAKQKMLRYLVLLVVTAFVFGSLFLAVRTLG
jgi:hypothetical protein